MSNPRVSMMEQIFGKPFEDKPTDGIFGILQTKNYEQFQILDDFGKPIHTFEGAKLAGKCLPGDHVCWKDDKCTLELRDAHPPIVGTVELTSKSKYGLTSRGIPIYLFVPYNKSYPPFVVGCSEKDVSRNKIGLAKFDDWTASSTFPRGQLQQLLGNSGDFEAEKQALIWQASPWRHGRPKGGLKTVPVPIEDTPREELKGFTFNIDPAGCLDVDDVFTFENLGEGRWRVTITISDVAAFVENGSEVDIMASLIGQTLYDDNGMVLRPMLPPEYSEGACSLTPGKKLLGISLQFIWNGSEISDKRWFESVFENSRSYTYYEFAASDSPFKAPLAAITSYLAKKELTNPHKWVEHMMLFYNTEAGKCLKSAGVGILRRHSAPDFERLEKYKEHIPELEMLAFSAAQYCLSEDDDTRHFGLESDTYTHSSSPIRRYADLLNQRSLKPIIRASSDRYIIPISMFDMNAREKMVKSFARDLCFLKAITADVNTFSGIIVDVERISESSEVKVRIYIPEWKRIINTKYRTISDNIALSRDEKREIDISLFREVEIACATNTNARCWKDRVIINII
jgi:exoribonuclease R